MYQENNAQTMNNDCLATIYNFMETPEVVKLSKGSAVERFPTKLTLASIDQVQQFNSWCGKFNTSRLEEVRIEIPRQQYGAGRGFQFGTVPRSVKKLTIFDDNFSVMTVPPTVEELVIERSCQRHIDLPNGIRFLELGDGFDGSIRTFPATLERLIIRGWGQPWGFDSNAPWRLRNIPDTVRVIEIGESVPVLIKRWPSSIQTVILPEYHLGVMEWLDRDHATIPEDVEVDMKANVPVWTPAPLARQYADPWWGEGDPPSDDEAWGSSILEWEE
jgi:hypothetical protein